MKHEEMIRKYKLNQQNEFERKVDKMNHEELIEEHNKGRKNIVTEVDELLERTSKLAEQANKFFPKSNQINNTPHTIYSRPKYDNELHVNEEKKEKGLSNDSVQFCIKYLSDTLNGLCSHCEPNTFNITKYMHIHGGACRDSITGKAIKDIDLSVDLNKIHLHAMKCKNNCCILAEQFQKKKIWYEKFGKIYANIDTSFCVDDSLLYMPLSKQLSLFLKSKHIINTGWLLKLFQSDKDFKKYCNEIKGPIEHGGEHLISYAIHFKKDNIIFDIMDNSCFVSGKGIKPNKSYYPITHKHHAQRTDCLFNALYIPLSSIIGVNMKEWGAYTIDPYTEEAELKVSGYSAKQDLLNGVVRPYGAFLVSLARIEYHQAELLIYRTMKNVHKLKGRDIIYISKSWQFYCTWSYMQWFHADFFVDNANENKKPTIQSILRHALNHKWYAKFDYDTIIAVFHLFGYDVMLLYWCHYHKEFNMVLEKIIAKGGTAAIIWEKITETGIPRISLKYPSIYDKEGHFDPYMGKYPDQYQGKSCLFKIVPDAFADKCNNKIKASEKFIHAPSMVGSKYGFPHESHDKKGTWVIRSMYL